MVAFTGDNDDNEQCIVGPAAELRQKANLENTFYDALRLLGKKYDSKIVRGNE